MQGFRVSGSGVIDIYKGIMRSNYVGDMKFVGVGA